MQQFIYSQLLWHTLLVDLMYTHSIRLQSILHKQSCVQGLVVLDATISSCSRKDICCYSYSFHTFYVLGYIPTFYVILHRICTAGTPRTSSSCYIVISTETIIIKLWLWHSCKLSMFSWYTHSPGTCGRQLKSAITLTIAGVKLEMMSGFGLSSFIRFLTFQSIMRFIDGVSPDDTHCVL